MSIQFAYHRMIEFKLLQTHAIWFLTASDSSICYVIFAAWPSKCESCDYTSSQNADYISNSLW